MARWLSRRPFWLRLDRAVVSFTFDDFPRSALLKAGAILGEQGFKGTYYASFGLMNQTAPTGKIFSREDLSEVARQQHELACHTFDHHDSWATAPAEFEASIIRNQQFLARQLPGAVMTSFSYPISWPRPQTKRRVAKHYRCARGGGQTFNSGLMDLNYLKAFFIEQSRENLEAIKKTIDANACARGWLIFATHDVSDSPTRYGCTPRQFQEVVNHVARSGAAVLPVAAALQRVLGAGAAAVEGGQGGLLSERVNTAVHVP